MPAASPINTLPEELREKLNAELLRRNFSGYQEMVASFNAILASRGMELRLSKSSVHRYGQRFEERVDAMKRATELARTMAKEVGDDEGAMNDALIRVIQEKLFTAAMELEIDPAEIDPMKLSRAAAELGRSSVMQKRHQVDMKRRAEQVATAVAETATKGGLSAEAVETIRREILGIVNE